ncbi:unnamed protein product, partial [Rotaria sp. Silwood2]
SQCEASIYPLYYADSDKVIVYKIEVEHNHHDDKFRGIDEKCKKSTCINHIMMV